jgi:hypothetical protein
VRKTRRFIQAAIGVLLLLSGYYALQYQREQRWLSDEAQRIVAETGASTRADQVRALRDHVRRHVRHEGVDVEGRPFFRASAKETLTSGQGYCGEATRAFICLARQLDINAQRVNISGELDHVVAEVEVEPRKWVLVDPQHNPRANGFLDQKAWSLREAITAKDSPFTEYSNLNLRRAPLVNLFVQRVKLHPGWLTWTMENPVLIKAQVDGGLAALLVGLYGLDRLLRRFYAHRLGVRMRRPCPQGVGT